MEMPRPSAFCPLLSVQGFLVLLLGQNVLEQCTAFLVHYWLTCLSLMTTSPLLHCTLEPGKKTFVTKISVLSTSFKSPPVFLFMFMFSSLVSH